MPKKKIENKVSVDVTFRINAIIRDGLDINTLIKEETDFIAEPQSANGCVIDMEIKNIKKV